MDAHLLNCCSGSNMFTTSNYHVGPIITLRVYHCDMPGSGLKVKKASPTLPDNSKYCSGKLRLYIFYFKSLKLCSRISTVTCCGQYKDSVDKNGSSRISFDWCTLVPLSP
jgi:hypothetical protein